jgi:hypothetical protein
MKMFVWNNVLDGLVLNWYFVIIPKISLFSRPTNKSSCRKTNVIPEMAFQQALAADTNLLNIFQ